MAETYDLIVRGGEVFKAKGLTVMPEVIDTQVHFREPGLEWKEGLETGSRAGRAPLPGKTARAAELASQAPRRLE